MDEPKTHREGRYIVFSPGDKWFIVPLRLPDLI